MSVKIKKEEFIRVLQEFFYLHEQQIAVGENSRDAYENVVRALEEIQRAIIKDGTENNKIEIDQGWVGELSGHFKIHEIAAEAKHPPETQEPPAPEHEKPSD